MPDQLPELSHRVAIRQAWGDIGKGGKALVSGAILVPLVAPGFFEWALRGRGFTESGFDAATGEPFMYSLMGAVAVLILLVAWFMLTAHWKHARSVVAAYAERNQELQAAVRTANATAVRLEQEVEGQVTADTSREAIARQMDGFARQYEALKREIPADQTGPGPVWSEENMLLARSFSHLEENVAGVLREHASGFVGYWKTNLRPLPPAPSAAHFEALADLSIEQLGQISRRLREGRDSP